MMRNELFDENLDIVSFNVNRGRDHGFDSYVEYRAAYGLSVPNSWKDMEATHRKRVVKALKSIYTNVKNVELYIGGATEKQVGKRRRDGYVGPLFAEIIGDGFQRLKEGDRFYFEGRDSGFTIDQINTIRSYSYSKLICDVGDVNTMPPNAFRTIGRGNPETLCGSLPALDVNLFNEKPACSWKILSRTGCCSGKHTLTRRCIGGTHCQAGSPGCEGLDVQEVKCTCSEYTCNTSCNKIRRREDLCADTLELDDMTCDDLMDIFLNGGDDKLYGRTDFNRLLEVLADLVKGK